MKTQTISFEQWRREAPALRAKSEQVAARLGPARREKPRNSTEAEFLRNIGTPERLIGPPAHK
jgi:hypothetical protein